MTDIEVPDFTRPRLALSGITVSTGATPVATREFSPAAELLLCGEIYDRRSGRGPLDARVTIKTRDGKIVYETPFAPASPLPGHQARIPLKDIGIGSYVATVEARSLSPKSVSTIRTIAFAVR